MAFRITVRGDGVELRGAMDVSPTGLTEFAEAMRPFGIVIASPLTEYDTPGRPVQ